MKKVDLPSGAKLEITLSPFAISRALFTAVAAELKAVKLDPKENVDVNFWKDLACTALASKDIERCLSECMKRVIYNGVKIDDNTFEPADARQDYLVVMMEVAKENLLPFMKDLSAQYLPILETLKKGQA